MERWTRSTLTATTLLQVIHDVRRAEKRRLRRGDLRNRFEEIRRAEDLDEPAAGMLQRLYV